jgi:hypothetical protein
MPGLIDNPFAVFSFLAAPAILTNASTVLALGTSNRLARAADRARLMATTLLASTDRAAAATMMEERDFGFAVERAKRLVRALRLFYCAAGSFAAGTCLSLVGAATDYFNMHLAAIATGAAAVITVVTGVTAIVVGAVVLIGETRLALRVLADEEAMIEEWRRGRKDVQRP